MKSNHKYVYIKGALQSALSEPRYMTGTSAGSLASLVWDMLALVICVEHVENVSMDVILVTIPEVAILCFR